MIQSLQDTMIQSLQNNCYFQIHVLYLYRKGKLEKRLTLNIGF